MCVCLCECVCVCVRVCVCEYLGEWLACSRHVVKSHGASTGPCLNFSKSECNASKALGQKDQTISGSWMPLWHLPVPKKKTGGLAPHPSGLFAHSAHLQR
jgi:hypothetical protein